MFFILFVSRRLFKISGWIWIKFIKIEEKKNA